MKHVLLLLAFIATTLFAVAQSDERGSYNYQRAMEAIKNDDYGEAMRYLQKAVEKNPKDGYSYMWIAHIYMQTPETFGKALSASNLALKYLPKKDNRGRSIVWRIQARVYAYMEQIERACECFDRAIALNPEETALYEDRADWLFSMELYDESDADYRKIIDLDPGDYTGYMGLGRNAANQGNYKAALAYFEQALNRNPTFAQIPAFQAWCNFELKDYNQAADNIIEAFEIEPGNTIAYRYMLAMADSACTVMRTKLEVKMLQEQQNGFWPLCMGEMNKRTKHYVQAINYFKQSLHLLPNPLIAYYVADTYNRLSQPQQALPYVEQAMAMDSTQVLWCLLKADIEFELGNFDQALQDYTRAIAVDFNELHLYYCYYKMGWIRELRHDYDAALRDYTTGLTLEPGYAYLYWKRGDLQRRHFNNPGAADQDFRQALVVAVTNIQKKKR